MNTTHIANPVPVSAERIISIESRDYGNIRSLMLESGRIFLAGHDMIIRHEPQIGDYLVTQEDGYVYIAPKAVFEQTYSPAPELVEAIKAIEPPHGFGEALAWLKAGKAVTRRGWNGKGMFVYMVPANEYPAQTDVAKAHFGVNTLVPYHAYFALKGIDGAVSTWVPSTNDVLSDDWVMADLTK